MFVYTFDCLPVLVFYVFCAKIGLSYGPESCPYMAVTLLENLPKSFVRVCDRPLLDGQSRLSGELGGRDSFLTLLDGPTFLKICRAGGAKPLGRVHGPVGTICPWRELPIASWVFCLTGTSTVELGRDVHVGHYPLFLFEPCYAIWM